MTVVVRQIPLPQERQVLDETLSRWLAPQAGGARLDWLYLQGPFGMPLVWLAEEKETGRPVGMAAAFRRRFLVDGAETEGFVFGDFCVDTRHRSLGPAIQLQRMCLAGVRQSKMVYGYDFPSTSMNAVYRRLGVNAQQEFVRLAKPLRTDRKIAQTVTNRWLAKPITAAANLALRVRDGSRGSGNSGEWSIAKEEKDFGPEFTELAKRACRPREISVLRSADYLNWRFRSHPHQSYRFLVARRDGELAGYVIYERSGSDATVVDLLVDREDGVTEMLLSCVAADVRDQGVMALSVSLVSTDRRAPIFESLGFRRRESALFVSFQLQDAALAGSSIEKANWLLMDGDRES